LLEIAFEEGLIGLASFLVLLTLVGVATLRMLSASRSHFLVLALLVLYCLTVSLFSGDLDDNRLLWLWMGVTLSICRLVQFRVTAFYSMQAMRRPAAGAMRPSPAPVFSRHFAAARNSGPQKDREWREKFVF
jgi:hypothetical protein